MIKIYGKANKLIIWLGEDADSSAAVISILKMASQRDFEQLHKQAELNASYNEHWSSILSFYSRPWFTRVWVIQEYVVFARKNRGPTRNHRELERAGNIDFYCGSSRLNASVLLVV